MAITLTKKNNAKTTLNGAITNVATSITVTDGSEFPAAGSFLVTIWDKVTYPDPSDDPQMEIVLCTSRSGNVLTVTRAQEGTTGVAASSGDAIEMLITTGHFSEIEAEFANYLPLAGGTLTGNLIISNTAPAITLTDTTAGDTDWSISAITDDLVIAPGTYDTASELTLNSFVKLYTSYSGAFAANVNFLSFNPTFTQTGSSLSAFIRFNPTITDSNGLVIFSAFIANPTITSSVNATLIQGFTLFEGSPTFSTSTSTVNPYGPQLFKATPTIRAIGVTAGDPGGIANGIYNFLSLPTVRGQSASGVIEVSRMSGYKSGVNLTTNNASAEAYIAEYVDFEFLLATGSGAGTEAIYDRKYIYMPDDTYSDVITGIYSELVSGNFITHVGGARSDHQGDWALSLDNCSILFGAADDASIYYDGTDLKINPKLVGSGVLDILGDLSLTAQNIITDTTTGTKIGTATTQKIGFWNVTPVVQPSAYTQTYSTANKTLNAYTTDDESAAYTGIDNAQGGTPYAQLTDLNALRVAYETLRASHDDLMAFVNSIVDDLQAIGLVA